jgi:hypothetical protein
MNPSTRAWRILAGVGALGAVVAYVGSTVVGGAIVPGYSHVEDSVSSLTSPGAPYRVGLAIGFAAYNVGVAALGVALPRIGARRSPLVTTAGALLVVCGGAGVLMLEPFPQDLPGDPVSAAGTVHIVLAGVSALTLVVATVLAALGWRKDLWARPLWPWSIAAGAAILVTGGVGSLALALGTSYFGLFERATQLSFLSWFALVGVFSLRGTRPRKELEAQ